MSNESDFVQNDQTLLKKEDSTTCLRKEEKVNGSALVNVEIDENLHSTQVSDSNELCLNHDSCQTTMNEEKVTKKSEVHSFEVQIGSEESDAFEHLRNVLRLDSEQFEEIRQFLTNQAQKTEAKCQQNVEDLVRG